MRPPRRLGAGGTLVGMFTVLMLTGGLGYAACTGGVGGGQSRGIDLEWTSPISTTVAPEFVVCSLSYETSLLDLAVKNLGPGALCSFFATLKNIGTVSAYLDSEYTIAEPRGCPYFVYSDNVHGLVRDPTLPPGGSFAYHGVLSLTSQAGNPCEGRSASLEVTVTGST